MIKTYLSALTVFLPAVSKINTLVRAFSNTVATALALTFKVLSKLRRIGIFLFQKQLSSTFTISKFARLPVVSLLILLFLAIGPHTSVLAGWEEKVVPDNHTILGQKITDEIRAVEIPKFHRPVEISYISTYFSRYHQGIDLPNFFGAPVRPSAGGVVTFAGWSNLGYGNLVIVRHELGYESLYAHLSDTSIKEGAVVTSESIIGRVGSTGVASGNHLHLEIHFKGNPINPLTLIP